MKRKILRQGVVGTLVCAWWMLGLSCSARAQQEPPTVVSVQAGRSESQLWADRYVHARRALLQDHWIEAARELDELAASATTFEQRFLAAELAGFARAKLERTAAQQGALRTTDELTTLYATAICYGLGTSAWLALQVEPNNVAGALIPFATLAPAAVGVVASADSFRPLRRGIPHAIAAGMYLGFGEGLWLVGFQNAYASAHAGTDRWGAQRTSTALWLAASAGGVAGALIGAVNRPTPGRVSFTASTAIWAGAFGAFAAHALNPLDRDRGQYTYLIGALAYNAGLLAGIVAGPVIAPSVKRVRYTDLGGLFGALVVGGGYALLADHADSRVGLGLAALGGGLGLGFTVWATRDMPSDRSHDRLQPLVGKRSPEHAALRPTLVPTPGGFFAGISGEL